jgi:hypothetical protein
MYGNQPLPHDIADCSTCAAAHGNEKQWVFPHHTKTRAHVLHLSDDENLAINRGFAAKFATLPGKSWIKTWEEVIYGYEQGHFKIVAVAAGEDSRNTLRIEGGYCRMSHPDIFDFPPEAIARVFAEFGQSQGLCIRGDHDPLRTEPRRTQIMHRCSAGGDR